MINVELEREITFDLPVGDFSSVLATLKPFIKQTNKGKQDWIRLVWDVEVLGMKDHDCRAGRNFLLSFKNGSDLRNFLLPVLGQEFFKKNSAKTFDLEATLKGTKGTVTLSHFEGEGYEKPMVMVESFEPVKVEGKD
jgi:hypothetical protein